MSKIKKAKLLKKAEHLELEFTEARPGFNSAAEMDGTFRDPLHDDLKNAFLSLRRHYAALSGAVDPMKVNVMELQEDYLKNFYASSFTFVRDGAALVLTGHRIIWNGKASNSNTPPEEIEIAEVPNENAYPYMSDLMQCVGTICTEVDLYLNGKRPEGKPEAQGQLAFTGDPVVTHMQVLPPADEVFLGQKVAAPEGQKTEPVPPRGRTKKVAQSAEAPNGEVVEKE